MSTEMSTPIGSEKRIPVPILIASWIVLSLLPAFTTFLAFSSPTAIKDFSFICFIYLVMQVLHYIFLYIPLALLCAAVIIPLAITKPSLRLENYIFIFYPVSVIYTVAFLYIQHGVNIIQTNSGLCFIYAAVLVGIIGSLALAVNMRLNFRLPAVKIVIPVLVFIVILAGLSYVLFNVYHIWGSILAF